MSSGVEIMICHAENLSRHLERVREDLNELRLKERLASDEPLTGGPLTNGSTRFGGKTRPRFFHIERRNHVPRRLCFLHLRISLFQIVEKEAQNGVKQQQE